MDQDHAAMAAQIREAEMVGNLLLAGRLADEAVVSHPQSAEMWAYAAHLLVWRGRSCEAAAALERARRLDPDCAITLAAAASVLSFEGMTAEATSAAARALELDDSDPWVLEKCMSALHAGQDPEAAVSVARRLVDLCSDTAWAAGHLVTSLMGSGRLEESEKVLAEAEKRFADAPELQRKRARLLLAAGRTEEGLAMFASAVESTPGDPFLLAEMARHLAMVGRHEQAERAAQAALEISSAVPQAMRTMADVCKRRGEHKEADCWIRRAASAIPALGAVNALGTAGAALARGKWRDAVRTIERALPQLTPFPRLVALEIKGRALVVGRRFRELPEIVKELEGADRRSPARWLLQGNLLESNKLIPEAVEAYRVGLASHATDGELRAALMKCLSSGGRSAELQALVSDTWEHMPERPAGFAVLAMALDKCGRSDDARRMRVAGLDRYPNDEALLLFAAVDRLDAGDAEGARHIAARVRGHFRRTAGIVGLVSRFIGWSNGLLSRSRRG